MLFYPEDAPIPERYENEEFVLRPLNETHVKLDHAALMVSKEMLRTWSGSTWPTDDFSVEENLEDMHMHYGEHLERIAFTYTMLTPNESECLGCVYIQPFARLLESNPGIDEFISDYSTRVAFWVKSPRLADGLDKRFLAALRQWLADDWAFEAVYFNVNKDHHQQQQILSEAGLTHKHSFNVPGRSGKYLLFG